MAIATQIVLILGTSVLGAKRQKECRVVKAPNSERHMHRCRFGSRKKQISNAALNTDYADAKLQQSHLCIIQLHVATKQWRHEMKIEEK